jgi:hypothetical protein
MSDTTTSEANGETKRKQVAKHELLAADGSVTKDISEATAIRYTDLDSKEVFEYTVPGGEAGKPITMLALFGAKTKATNEASQFRQAVEKGDEPDVSSQVEAIREAFAMIDTGVWREKAEGGGFARIDRAVLAQAIIDVKQAANAPHEDEAFYTQKLTDDPKYLRLVRQVPEVTARYNELKNVTVPKKSVADI